MLQRLIGIILVAGAGYWYWTGPYQDKVNPDYARQLDNNDAAVSECIKSTTYKTGLTGQGPDAASAEANCAEQLNLYEEEGRWHSYGTTRPK
ncbi:MAG: hypothetical protein HKN19_08315 [Halioglobus sp.]|nr:hypothetical protein [Halioglobus sp.]